MGDRGYVITDEEYQQQALMPVETTRAVFTAIFGREWKRGALAIFGRYTVNESDIAQWERFGCPPWVLNDMLPFLRAMAVSAEGQRRAELETALRTVPVRSQISGVTRH